jgi:quercetin dioxygenase-like cupin family protein
MKVVNMNKVSKEVFIHPIFTGREVTRQVLLPESKEYEVNIINFGKGVRNKFHAHEYEQILIVTEGKGVVATEKEERRS